MCKKLHTHTCSIFQWGIVLSSGTFGQGIRTGGAVVPITGPAGLQSQTTDRRISNTGSLRVSTFFSFSSYFLFFAFPFRYLWIKTISIEHA